MAEPSTTALSVSGASALGFLENAIASFEGVQRLAEVMSKCGTMPAHLKNPSDCFRVVVQAAKWRMDPFAVAECTSLVHGRMCYEGKLVAAVLQAMGAIEGRLTYEITGKGQEASIVVTGTPKGAKKPASLSGTVKEWRTHGNGSPWDKQPETMLVYRGTRQWARLYAPEAILGVYTPDEAEEMRTVEAEVVHTDPPPARTGMVPAESSASTSSGTNGAPAGTDPGTKPATAPAHPAVVAARDLYRSLEKAEKGKGKRLIDRLCKLAGGTAPQDVPEKHLEQFGKDVAALAEDLPNAEANLSEWERRAAEEGTP